MTFLEAAIEVLKREGKSLPAKRLTELALKHNLLSVVGRDPEGTMVERLDAHLETEAHRSELMRLQPGVYTLKVFPPRPYPPIAEKTAAAEAGAGSTPGASAEGGASPRAGEGAQAEGVEGGGARRKRRRRRRRGGAGAAGAGSAVATEADADEAGADDEEGDDSQPPSSPGEASSGTATATATAEAGVAAPSVVTTEAGAALAEPLSPVAERLVAAPRTGEDTAAVSGEAGEEEAAAEAGAAERRGRRRSRRGGRGRRNGDRAGSGAGPDGQASLPFAEGGAERLEPTSAAEGDPGEPTELAHAQTLVAPPSALADEHSSEEGGFEDELFSDDIDLPSGPVLAPSAGAEETTRTEDDRVVTRATPGFRVSEDRVHHHGRHRRDRRDERGGRGGRGERGDRGERADRGERQAEASRRHESSSEARTSGPATVVSPAVSRPPVAISTLPVSLRADGGATRLQPVLEALVESLRTGASQPRTVAELAALLVGRPRVDGSSGLEELTRQVRAALVRDERERTSEGLRPRLLHVGAGSYELAERRLEPELLPLEREVAERVARLRESTRAALRRRLLHLAPPAFEALVRALLDRLGVVDVEQVRRAEGVVYLGGVRQAGSTGGGAAGARVLIAVRAGEAEISRRAVGELRAGLEIKGYDEGLLFAGGRLGAEGQAEHQAAPAAVTLYDGQTLAALLVRHGLGVRRVMMPVDYLDLELLNELSSPTEG